MPKKLSRIVGILLLSVLLSNCGQRGPLYLPDKNTTEKEIPETTETTQIEKTPPHTE